jgi:uncharacterized membrane protein
VSDPVRRVVAALVAMTLAALVACDLWIGDVRLWWDRHSLTGSVVSNLLVLAVTALIVDDVVARRQRRQRAVSVAVQGLIVFGQARRAFGAITTVGAGDLRSSGAPDELRTLAAMVLTASPSLFDDPAARRFLEQVERFSVSMLRAVSTSSGGGRGTDGGPRLVSEMEELKVAVEPLLARIPPGDRSLLEEAPQA